MSKITEAIKELFESNQKYPPYGHEIYFEIKDGKSGYIIVSKSSNKNYFIDIRIPYNYIEKEQVEKLKKIRLKNAEKENFSDSLGVWLAADFKNDEKYIEELILKIFREVWGVEDFLSLSYEILPI